MKMKNCGQGKEHASHDATIVETKRFIIQPLEHHKS